MIGWLRRTLSSRRRRVKLELPPAPLDDTAVAGLLSDAAAELAEAQAIEAATIAERDRLAEKLAAVEADLKQWRDLCDRVDKSNMRAHQVLTDAKVRGSSALADRVQWLVDSRDRARKRCKAAAKKKRK